MRRPHPGALKVQGVSDCAVVGSSDYEFGEQPVAYIVAEVDCSPDELLQRVLAPRAHQGRILTALNV